MKKSKFSDSQIMDALKRVEAGLPVPELCREVGISQLLQQPVIVRDRFVHVCSFVASLANVQSLF